MNPIRKLTFFNIYGGCNQGEKYIRRCGVPAYDIAYTVTAAHDLEEEIGKKLLIRGNRRITLTEEGMLLRKRATEILDLVDKTEAELMAPDEAVGGDIYIGGGETDAMRHIARIAKDLQKSCPQIHYHLFSGNADDVTGRLDKGLLDFGILIEPADMKKYDYIRLPATDTWGLLMPKDCPLASHSVVRPKDLWGLPIITSNQTMVSNEFSGWLGKEYEKLNIVASYMCPSPSNLLKQAMQEMQGRMSASCPAKALLAQLGSARCARAEAAKSKTPSARSCSAKAGSRMRATARTGIETVCFTSHGRCFRQPWR